MTNNARCIHRHSPKTHPNCFKRGLVKKPDWWEGKKVAYLDIETSDFNANFGIILSWCLKYKGNKKIRYSVITRKEIFDYDFDKRVVEELLEAIEDVDILVTYYGTRFDIPFVRTRAEFWNIPFPTFSTVFHWDLYYKVRRYYKINRNSLASITAFLGIEGKTPIAPSVWFLAKYGDKKSLKEVLSHNKGDVIILEELHERLGGYSKWIRTSI